ncbi:TRAP transporter small permease [Sedimentitalea sp. XS_ASV28]|uniref:TRAP transporter small permease n=1 Tax=Sedimentitalea sp. XS_ASV28 TaxID=3241296 RepID=UPI003514D543
MNLIRRCLNLISNLCGAVAVLFLAFLMFGITVDVFARVVGGRSISGIFEMSELSLVMIVFMGAMWAQRDRAHIRVNILSQRMKGPSHRLVMGLAWLCGALALAMIAWPATQEAIYSVSILEFRWGYTQVPIWWTKVGVALGLWLAAVQMCFSALDVFVNDEIEQPAGDAQAEV